MVENASGKREFTRPSGSLAKRYDALVALQNQILAKARRLSRQAASLDIQPGEDIADQSTEEILRETELTLMTEEQRKLHLIEEALRRISEGTYGVCVDCGKRIASKRLDLIPYAKLCVHCKEAREANDGLPPDFEKRDFVDELVE
jgi:DnaK suppressor protein